MRDAPAPELLLDLIAATLRATATATTPEAVYARRIAASLADTVARELRDGPAADAAELSRLRAMLGDGDLPELNATLANALRDGTLSLETPAAVDHLWATTLAKCAIDQPRYDTIAARG